MKRQTGPYRKLIRLFLERQITADEFQTGFFKLYKNDDTDWDDKTFRILDRLFGDLDSFIEEPDLLRELEAEKPGYYLDEERLRARAEETLSRLQ